jgi:hypothetical protein
MPFVLKKIMYTILYNCRERKYLNENIWVKEPTLNIKAEKMNEKYMYPNTFSCFVIEGLTFPCIISEKRPYETASYVFGDRSQEDGHTVNQIGPDCHGFESRSGKVFYLKRSLSLLFPGLKRPGRQANHSPPSSA